MKKTTDLNPERNEKYQYLDKLSYVPRLIIISACCGFLAFVAMVMSVLAQDDAKEANIRSQMQTERIEELSDEIGVMKVYITQHKSKQGDE